MTTRWIANVLIGCLLLLCGCPGYLMENAIVRKGPGAQHHIVKHLLKGTKVEVAQHSNGQIISNNGYVKILRPVTGWVPAGSLSADPPPAPQPRPAQPRPAATHPAPPRPTLALNRARQGSGSRPARPAPFRPAPPRPAPRPPHREPGEQAVTPDAKYTTAHLNARTGPSTSRHVLRVLAPGTKVRVVARAGAWRKIDEPLGAWVNSAYLTDHKPGGSSNARPRPNPAPRPAARPPVGGNPGAARTFTGAYTKVKASERTVKASVEVRRGPGTAYTVIVKIVSGTPVTVVGKKGSWRKISRPFTGWILSSRLAPPPPAEPAAGEESVADEVAEDSGEAGDEGLTDEGPTGEFEAGDEGSVGDFPEGEADPGGSMSDPEPSGDSEAGEVGASDGAADARDAVGQEGGNDDASGSGAEPVGGPPAVQSQAAPAAVKGNAPRWGRTIKQGQAIPADWTHP